MSQTPASPTLVVDEKLTRKIAALARLELTELEVTTFTAQLGDILRYVDQLQAADVTGIEPMYQALGPLAELVPFREDVVRESPVDAQGAPKVLEHSPRVEDAGYRVPQVL
jgi:aspartyl-tRNA(Asn)/glutamyl-tRNA(Gln) amidotransferase subunit C